MVTTVEQYCTENVKVAKSCYLKSSYHKEKKLLSMYGDRHGGDHFAIYANIELFMLSI